jgi:hypothetical protein
MTEDEQEVLGINQAFYAAHEAQSLAGMAEVWDHDDRSACIHPGWPILRGWPAIEESWRRIFGGPGHNQFIVTNEQCTIRGDVAWITLDENLVSAAGTGTIAATNVFVRRDVGWRLTVHHGSPVMPSTG